MADEFYVQMLDSFKQGAYRVCVAPVEHNIFFILFSPMVRFALLYAALT